MTTHIREYETSTAICTFTGETATYRLWEGVRHCFNCGADHEEDQAAEVERLMAAETPMTPEQIEDERYHVAMRDIMDEQANRFAPCATMSDAHSEWHLNAGVPMGTPGCPQDACHADDDDYEVEVTETGVRCGNRKSHGQVKVHHHDVDAVRLCFDLAR